MVRGSEISRVSSRCSSGRSPTTSVGRGEPCTLPLRRDPKSADKIKYHTVANFGKRTPFSVTLPFDLLPVRSFSWVIGL